MQVTVTIHEPWLNRPEDLRRIMALLAGLEIPPPGSASASEPQGYDPRGHRGAVRPGRASPGPAVEPAGSGRRLGTAGGGPRRGRPEGRQAIAGLGVEADPRPEGGTDRLRQEEGAAFEDRGMDPAAGRGGVPVRPGAIVLDPIVLPTPRADAFRGGFPRIGVPAPSM